MLQLDENEVSDAYAVHTLGGWVTINYEETRQINQFPDSKYA